MDDSNDFQMNFREFVLNMWNFCTRSKQSISTFAFDIFDDDDNGSLNSDEITDMVQRIYGKKGLSHDIKLIIKKMDKNRDNKIDKKEFIGCVDSFPALLFPAFHLQTTFRMHCVNEKFWVEKQLQAASIRKMPEVVELFQNRGNMAKRKVVNHSKRKKTKNNKVAVDGDYDGVDLGAHMSEERVLSEHRQSEHHSSTHQKRSTVNSEDDAARVIQAANIRKKNKKKREAKKKEAESENSAARVIQAAQVRKKNKKNRDAAKNK